jgi:osmotically-inducible protein OsmY
MKRTRSIYSIGTFILAGAISGCAAQKACPGSRCTGDERTTAAVNAAFSGQAELGPSNQIEVWSDNHVVYLSGIVDTPYQRSVAERVAARTGGVVKVVNSIGVTN